jgi:uncharacterized membrane protein YqaE (UPF0057 family)
MDLLRIIVAILLLPLGVFSQAGVPSSDNLTNTLIIRLGADHREITLV